MKVINCSNAVVTVNGHSYTPGKELEINKAQEKEIKSSILKPFFVFRKGDNGNS